MIIVQTVKFKIILCELCIFKLPTTWSLRPICSSGRHPCFCPCVKVSACHSHAVLPPDDLNQRAKSRPNTGGVTGALLCRFQLYLPAKKILEKMHSNYTLQIFCKLFITTSRFLTSILKYATTGISKGAVYR